MTLRPPAFALSSALLLALPLPAQQAPTAAPAFIKVPSNLVTENIPPIPRALSDSVERYAQSRAALFLDWHPTERSLLISTRFADTAQVHAVRSPGADRKQLTFFPDRISGARYLPDGRTLLVHKDVGGGEWFQIYRDNLETAELTLLTDGHSRNGAPLLAHHSTLFAFNSTHRNNKDTDLWVADASSPASARLLLQVEGGGWEPVAWSPDNKQLLVVEEISANESYLYLVDVATGAKQALTPKGTGDPVSYGNAVFSHDGRSLYVVTDRDSDFQRLARFDLATRTPRYLSTAIPWDVEDLAITDDGSRLAFVTNENGISRFYLLNTAKDTYRPLPNLPAGVSVGIAFHPNGRDLAFSLTNAHSPLDTYSVDVNTGKLDRWTESETGGLDAHRFIEGRLIQWKSFDGRVISGYFYAPDPARFPGRRPVMISIHGGPEGQVRPAFLAGENYVLDQLGVAILEPNVRGSTGYGKTFLKLDNGMHRDESYKDINALLDWVGQQPALDPARVMVTGGSYGGHMTWAVAAFYNDRIRCALPIVGMSNLVTFLENTEAYRRDLRRAEYGDERDPAMRAYLEKIAPMNHLDTMHKPVFAVVGKNDPRVPWTESRQILDKLKAQGTPTWFLMANDEGHGFAKKTNRDFQFKAQVLFVQQYLLDGMPASPTQPATAAGAP